MSKYNISQDLNEIEEHIKKSTNVFSFKPIIKVDIYKNKAFELCVEYIKIELDEDQSNSKVIELAISDIYKIMEFNGIVHNNILNMNFTKLAFRIPLFDKNGVVSTKKCIDAIPLSSKEDSRFSGGSRSTCNLSEEHYKYLETLKFIYKLNSDHKIITHILVVYASILKLRHEGLTPETGNLEICAL